MARLLAGRNQKFVYGTSAIFSFKVTLLTKQYATYQLTVPLGGDSSAPVPGTIIVAGTTVTLAAVDCLSAQAIAAKIVSTGIAGYAVGIATNGYTVVLTSTTVGPIAKPTVALGTATQILFNDVSFINGVAMPAGTLDDIKVSGRTPIQINMTSTGGAPIIQQSIGSDDEQVNGTLVYTTVTLSSGAATITTPIDYLRVSPAGASQVNLYINR
jgi:hypothetical protein